MIDVLLSARNGEKYLRKSVRSILSQTYKDFVFYIINDASVDNSAEIIKSFHDKRIVFFQNKKTQGLTKNLNFLLKQGKGEYIARQDADDISRPERFEKQLQFLEENKFDLVGSDARLIDEKGKIIGEKKYESKKIKSDLIKLNMFPHSSWFGKRKIFEELNAYNVKFTYSQDYDFLLRAAGKFKLGIIPEKLVDIRWDENSLSLFHLKEQQKYALYARIMAMKRGDYSAVNYFHLIRPLISYLLPSAVNKFIYKIPFLGGTIRFKT